MKIRILDAKSCETTLERRHNIGLRVNLQSNQLADKDSTLCVKTGGQTPNSLKLIFHKKNLPKLTLGTTFGTFVKYLTASISTFSLKVFITENEPQSKVLISRKFTYSVSFPRNSKTT